MTERAVSSHTAYDYTKGSVGRGLFRLTLPSCLEQLAWNVDGLAEIFWVGRLGPEFLAAMSLGYMVTQILRAIPFGGRVAGQALVAQRVGAGKEEDAALMAGQTIALSLLFTVPMALLGVMLAPRVLDFLTDDRDIIRHGVGYLRAGFPAIVMIELNNALAHIHRGAGEPAYSLSGMSASTACTFLLLPLLIFGWGPFPALGLTGAFLGIGLGRFGGVSTMLFLLFSGRSRLPLRPRHLVPRPELLARFVSIGWPVSVQLLFERGANFVLLMFLARFGAVPLAAGGVGNRMAMYARLPTFGLQNATRTLVGQNLGAGRLDRAWRSAWAALGAGFSLMMLVVALMIGGAPQLVGFLGMEGEAAAVAVVCLRILLLGALFEALARVLAGAFQGAAHTKPPMLVEGSIRWGVLVPGAYLMAFPFGFQAVGIWWTTAASQVLVSAVLFWLFCTGRWRGRDALSPEGGRLSGGGGGH